MTDVIVRETKSQQLIREVETIWQQYQLPSGDLRDAMQDVGDVADFAEDPYRYSEYKLKITAKAVAARASQAAKRIYEDPERRMAAGARWNEMADTVGYSKHHLARGGFWTKALGCTLAVQEFEGTDEGADARVKAALDDWKASQKPDGSALDGDPDAHALEQDQAETRRLNAADGTLSTCEICGGAIVAGQCDTCEARYENGQRVPDRADTPPALTPETIKAAGEQVATLLKEAFPGESKQALIARYKDASGGFTGIFDRVKALDSVEKALDEVKVYIDKVKIAPPDEPDDRPPSSNGWDGESSGDLIIRAQALARVLRGPETNIAVSPERLADMAWRSGLYAGVNSFERAFMIIMEALELGISPTAGLKHIQVITSSIKENGQHKGTKTQTSSSIHLMLALCFASGEMADFSIKDGVVMAQRVGMSPSSARYSGQGAGAEKDIRRAVRLILRQVFSDVLLFGLRVQKQPPTTGALPTHVISDRGIEAIESVIPF